MSTIGQIERATQNRIIQLFVKRLGFKYLGNWEENPANSNVEETLLKPYLKKCGYNDTLIRKAIYELKQAANSITDDLYTNNQKVYNMLRYGVSVKEDAGVNFQNVQLINWKNIEANEFGIAEEVTVFGQKEKRPDLVLYVNGIALGIIELKRGIKDVTEGIRQNLNNQKAEFIRPFFNTIQLVMAGNDSQGLRYGTTDTPEKMFLTWKEETYNNEELFPIDKHVLQLCNKQRFMEIIYDFVLFDGGIKKLCRPHQFFGIKAAQKHVQAREGGIIWHSQGSGKSIVMVLLAKWILENNPNARVAILTDRDELDKQIERVFEDAGESIKRTSSGRDLLEKLEQPLPRILCSLIHKFGRGQENEFVEEIEFKPIKPHGELFVFVDECHRTQSGKLHKAMKKQIPNAVFIGFTGTPLLKTDSQTSLEVFGKYIHTYKFNEAVTDKVVLDLVYEARDIDQNLSSPERVDQWFEAKTKGLNDFQKSELKKKWGTMQRVLSSKKRMDKIVADIVYDFSTKTRLSNGKGNAILVASSIYEACRYYDLFQTNELKGKVGLITSYQPITQHITTEETGADTETEKQELYNIYMKMLDGKTTEQYEDWAKEKFIKEPAKMKVLIVRDKLLTGFDAPSCTYLYIDKNMQDHGLFQAICRVNRLDSADKQFGYIVDYKDLFKKLVNEDGTGAIQVYTSELDYDEFKKEDCDILLKSRLEKGKERLDQTIEEMEYLLEPVPMPKDDLAYIRYFCGDPEREGDLKATELRRTALYKCVVAVIRSYANVKADLDDIYTTKEITRIEEQVTAYLNLREIVRRASNEVIDLKAYEADMRHLIDTYIQADDSVVISQFAEMPLLWIIQNAGIDAAIESMPNGIRSNKQAVAETIENNVRSNIIRDHLIDPAYFEEMSFLLNALIVKRRNKAIEFNEYLRQMALLANKVDRKDRIDLPPTIKTAAQTALYNNLGKNEQLALEIDEAVKRTKMDGFRGDEVKERIMKKELFAILKNKEEVEYIFEIIKAQPEY
ncbi:MAG: HsdR family type I site-specific deoxyribonuclease [Bacteroidota bacterium]|nr:HsdR family type I site-specific deoxyribonuclease [Bacteroidota bacterium]